MSTAPPRAEFLSAGVATVCSVLVTALAHATAGGAIPTGSALVELFIVCATVSAGIGAIDVEGRHARAALMIAALGAGQGLGHLTLASVGHHHAGPATSIPVSMLAMHAVAAVVIGLLEGAAEHLYAVCSSVLSWLRLFATPTLAPAATRVCHYPNVVVLQPVPLRTGLGMRAPPQSYALGA